MESCDRCGKGRVITVMTSAGELHFCLHDARINAAHLREFPTVSYLKGEMKEVDASWWDELVRLGPSIALSARK